MDQLDYNRAQGAVIGSAVGDALGAPFEGFPANTYRSRFPEPVLGGIGELIGGGVIFDWAPGEFTDDTQMAVIQALSLLDCGGFDGADLFDRFVDWAASANDVGAQTGEVLSDDEDWTDAADAYFRLHPNGSAGNGALMRATLVAVHFAAGDLAASMQAARRFAAVTHGDPAAQWGAALYHAMIHAALRSGDLFDALDAALALLPPDQERFVEMLAPTWEPGDTMLNNGTVWTCLAQAVWAVRTTDTFADAVTAAIQLGGDTDTVAAVTGGLAGATYGIAAIPSRWSTYLHGHVPGYDSPVRAADLQQLTRQLLGKIVAPEQDPEPGVGPTEIVAGVYAANLAGAASTGHDHAIISLCRVGERFYDYPLRREVYLIDQEGDANPDLHSVVTDTVDTIDAFRAEGHPVVVHCYGGASRTGLVLRAWLMRTNRWDEPTATAHLADRWPHLRLWNDTFTQFLLHDWDVG